MTTVFPFVLQVAEGQFEYNEHSFRFVRPGNRNLEQPLLNILWAELEGDDRIHVSLLVARNEKWSLDKLTGVTKSKSNEATDAARQWVKSLLDLAYDGRPKQPKLRILVNPVGGKGKGRLIYEREVKPIFDAAKCSVDVTVTTRRAHMIELAEKVDLDCNAVVILSGDGGVHEVVNGLAKHEQAHKALKIPLVQIPTGSANAVCVNILGPKDAFNIQKACLTVLKGKPMKHTIYSITQGERKYLSFLSQAAGLMADLDLGTESLRWMGDGRFIVGYLRGVVTKKICPIEIEYKLVQNDKIQMAKSAKENAKSTYFYPEEEEDHTDGLPWLNDESNASSSDGWTKFDQPVIYLYAGGLPYVARDLMQFPCANPSDGCIDLVIQSMASRGLMVKATSGADKGEHYWLDCQHYLKVSTYRVKPKGPGNLSMDGEHVPFEPFEVKVHPGFLRLLSMDGRYNIDAFTIPTISKS